MTERSPIVPTVRECEHCHSPIVSGQRYRVIGQGPARSRYHHERWLGCLVSMLVRASRHVGG